jgi:hypothetical protein
MIFRQELLDAAILLDEYISKRNYKIQVLKFIVHKCNTRWSCLLVIANNIFLKEIMKTWFWQIWIYCEILDAGI